MEKLLYRALVIPCGGYRHNLVKVLDAAAWLKMNLFIKLVHKNGLHEDSFGVTNDNIIEVSFNRIFRNHNLIRNKIFY